MDESTKYYEESLKAAREERDTLHRQFKALTQNPFF